MLHLENLHKSFGSTEVLHGVSLDARKGDVVAVIGPSGSGKTTPRRSLDGLATSAARRLPPGRRRAAGPVFWPPAPAPCHNELRKNRLNRLK